MGDIRLRRQYAIVGMGLDVAIHEDQAFRSVEAEVARQAVASAGLTPQDIDLAIHCEEFGGGGRPHTWSDHYPRMLGMPVNAYLTMSRGGVAAALMSAVAHIGAGLATNVVITRVDRDQSNRRAAKKEGRRGLVHPVEPLGVWGKAVGDVTGVMHHAYFAKRHMHEYGTTSRQLGAISVSTRKWSHGNPLAQMRGREMTIEDHQNSPLMVDPYHMFDLCQISDGAVAIVVTSADRARDMARPPIYLMGIGYGEHMAKLWWEKANYTQLAVRTAKEAAFREAEITLDDLDFAQLYDCFTGEVLLQIEDYGWCAKGEGGPFAEAGNIAPGGTIPINTGGGLLSAYHIGDMTGLSETLTQLWHEGGDRQIPDARLGMFTGHGMEITRPGMCSRHACVVLGRD